jgi:hypothetical protein
MGHNLGVRERLSKFGSATSCSDAEVLGLVSFHFVDSSTIVSQYRSEYDLKLEPGETAQTHLLADAALLWSRSPVGFDHVDLLALSWWVLWGDERILFTV